MILYRHFDSKSDLYLQVLDRMVQRLISATESPHFTENSIRHLLDAAAEDPDGFQLLFRHTAREPEFREHTNMFQQRGVEVARQHLAAMIPDQQWAEWAAALVPAAVIEGVIAWLDAGQPDPQGAADRLMRVVSGIVEAASMDTRGE